MYPGPTGLGFIFWPDGGERSDELLFCGLFMFFLPFLPSFFLQSLITSPRTFLTLVEASQQMLKPKEHDIKGRGENPSAFL